MKKSYAEYPETIELEITQEDIDTSNAARGAGLDFAILTMCVASCAGKRVFPDAEKVISAGDYVSIDYTAYYVSEELRAIIRAFDMHETISPCKLVLTKRGGEPVVV